MTRIYAAISYKGGTGRTTASANVGYHLARSGTSTCVVDLDLTSPTFGAVLEMPKFRLGAEMGVHDILTDSAVAREPRDLRKSVWRHSEKLGLPPERAADFDLIPGKETRRAGMPVRPDAATAGRLAEALERLREHYEVIILDVRSGMSDATAILNYALQANGVSGPQLAITSWLVFFRWTPQHLTGTSSLCETLSRNAEVRTVRTAYDAPTAEAPGWYREQHRQLTDEMDEVLAEFAPIADIPFESMLRWRETVIVESDVQDGIAAAATEAAYRRLATKLKAAFQ